MSRLREREAKRKKRAGSKSKEWGVGKIAPAPLKRLNRKIKKAVGL